MIGPGSKIRLGIGQQLLTAPYLIINNNRILLPGLSGSEIRQSDHVPLCIHTRK